MIKFINILLLTLIVSAASATQKAVFMELETTNNSYSIKTDCQYGQAYILNFKLTRNIIQNYNAFHRSQFRDLIVIETESHTIIPMSANIESKSDIQISLDEDEFKKLGSAWSAKIYIDAKLFDRALITDTYKKSQPYYSPVDPYRPLFPEAGAFTYVKPRISLSFNNSDAAIRKCNSERNAQKEKDKTVFTKAKESWNKLNLWK